MRAIQTIVGPHLAVRLLATLFVLLLVPGAAFAATPLQVLILRGDSPDLPGGRIAIDAIQSTVRSQITTPVDFYLETIDSGRFTGEEYERRLADLFAVKYAGRGLDLVVTLSEPAARFVLRERAALFPRAPVLFGMIPSRALDRQAMPAEASAVYVRIDASATLRMAFRGLPSARRVLVVGGSSRFDRSWIDLVRDELRGFDPGVPVTYDTDSSIDGLVRTMSALSADTVVLFASMTRDAAGVAARPTDVIKTLRAAAKVPIFAVSSTYVGQGSVGGFVLDFDRHGADLGRHAVRMLAGERPLSITTPAIATVDWRELQRFNIPLTSLPASTVVAFRQPGLWEREKGTIIAASLVCAAQFGLILALVLAGRRQRATVLQREQAEMALERSDHLKGAILDSLPAHIAVLDRDGTIIAVNHAWSAFGAANALGPAAVVGPGSNYLRACIDGARAGAQGASEAVRVIERTCRGRRTKRQVEYRSDGPDSQRWFLMTAEPLRRAEGGAVVTHWDITRRKRNEIALRESEDRFRRMADALPIAIWTSDAGGACTYLNREWLQLTGRNLEKGLGNAWIESVHADDRAHCVDEYRRALAALDGFRMEFRILRHDGEYRWFLGTGMPRYGSDGAFLGYVGGSVDITERKETERLLRGVNHRLMQAQDDERRRIARELHDHLSQQLALLAIDLQQAAMEPLAKAEDLLPTLQDAWRRTTEIASDVHAVSHRLHPSKMEALGLVATIGAHCRDVSRQGLVVRFLHHDVPAHLPPDRTLGMFRVLEEAVSNVVRHSGATEAQVSLVGSDTDLVLRVSDDGRGFTMAEEPFSGLGLISMRERLESLNGSLSVTTAPGQGTVIEARVPLDAVAHGVGPLDILPGSMRPAGHAPAAARPRRLRRAKSA